MRTSGPASATMLQVPAGVAQLAEQPSCKRQVSGSNPLTGSRLIQPAIAMIRTAARPEFWLVQPGAAGGVRRPVLGHPKGFCRRIACRGTKAWPMLTRWFPAARIIRWYLRASATSSWPAVVSLAP